MHEIKQKLGPNVLVVPPPYYEIIIDLTFKSDDKGVSSQDVCPPKANLTVGDLPVRDFLKVFFILIYLTDRKRIGHKLESIQCITAKEMQ
jgi:hypothetical protein